MLTGAAVGFGAANEQHADLDRQINYVHDPAYGNVRAPLDDIFHGIILNAKAAGNVINAVINTADNKGSNDINETQPSTPGVLLMDTAAFLGGLGVVGGFGAIAPNTTTYVARLFAAPKKQDNPLH
jgi:hypothetical protein